MAKHYELLIHGTGFRVQDGKGGFHREFYAHRRITAKSTPQASAHGVAALKDELNADPRFQGAAQPIGSALTVEECYPIGWITRTFTKAPTAISFRT